MRRKPVARLMRLSEVRAKQVRRFKATTDSRHNLPVAENHLNRQFDPKAPDEAWAADITFIWTQEGWLYLAVIMDLFSRRIIGWSMRPRLKRALVIDALKMATGSRHVGNGLLCHSDRGSQYASGDYQTLLARASIVCSMSRKGDCWDNAPVESFFARLEAGARVSPPLQDARRGPGRPVSVYRNLVQQKTTVFVAGLPQPSRLRGATCITAVAYGSLTYRPLKRGNPYRSALHRAARGMVDRT